MPLGSPAPPSAVRSAPSSWSISPCTTSGLVACETRPVVGVLLELGPQPRERERLEEVEHHPLRDRPPHHLQLAHRRHRDRVAEVAVETQLRQQVEAVPVGQVHVEQQQVGRLAPQDPPRVGAGARDADEPEPRHPLRRTPRARTAAIASSSTTSTPISRGPAPPGPPAPPGRPAPAPGPAPLTAPPRSAPRTAPRRAASGPPRSSRRGAAPPAPPGPGPSPRPTPDSPGLVDQPRSKARSAASASSPGPLSDTSSANQRESASRLTTTRRSDRSATASNALSRRFPTTVTISPASNGSPFDRRPRRDAQVDPTLGRHPGLAEQDRRQHRLLAHAVHPVGQPLRRPRLRRREADRLLRRAPARSATPRCAAGSPPRGSARAACPTAAARCRAARTPRSARCGRAA